MKTFTNEDIYKQLSLGILSLHFFLVLASVMIYNLLTPQKEEYNNEVNIELLNQTQVRIRAGVRIDTIPFDSVEAWIMEDNL